MCALSLVDPIQMDDLPREERVDSPGSGRSAPLGASITTAGVNFSVYSRTASGIDLLLFNSDNAPRPVRTIPLDRDHHRTYHYWHVFVPGVQVGQIYGYRAHGPYEPRLGHRFDAKKVLLDPYGRAVVVPQGYSRKAAQVPGDNTTVAFKSVVADPSGYDWEGDVPLQRPYSETVIYELHVRGFTRHASSGVAPSRAGTYAGLIEKIPYLQDLGVTAVELMPVFQFDPQDAPADRLNYWGYSPVSFFAPHSGYSSRTDPLGPMDEFRDMVKALHRAGIEVILDVVFNHTAEGDHRGPTFCFRGLENATYYQLDQQRERYANFSGTGNALNANHSVVRRMIRESLRYWVDRMHVDGFRFDLASILSRDGHGRPLENPPILWDIESDPVLAGTKLIAEAWDAAGLYQLGDFIGDSWCEWNGQFRDDVRSFMKADRGTVKRLARRILGSPDLFGHEEREPEQSINFVTCHDGFTLNDLVSYNCKHNEANGEDNRDGTDENLSWNCGVEGPTDDAAIEGLRNRQVKNFLTLSLLSTGMPMLLMGDEVRRTQLGNNNAYCQDNETSWFDWGALARHADVHRFARLLIMLRLNARGKAIRSLNESLRDAKIAWHGVDLHRPDWSDDSHSLAFTATTPDGRSIIHCIANAYWEALEFQLPPAARVHQGWHRLIDTALAPPDDILPVDDGPPVTGTTYRAQPRSVVVLWASRSATSGARYPSPETKGQVMDNSTTDDHIVELQRLYGCGPIQFYGTDSALYERHLIFDQVIDPASASPREQFEAVARSTRDFISQRWLLTGKTYEQKNPKRVYYLSMEFLLGRSLVNNLINAKLAEISLAFLKQKRGATPLLVEAEPDAGLGNGGLGRLAACFLDSMATLELPGMGYGLRYEYGIFKQTIQDGWQLEQPDNWLRRPDPWEVARLDEAVEVHLNCSFELRAGELQPIIGRPSTLLGIPFDRPVIGYGGRTINTLRLWAAATPDYFDFQQFSRGDFVGALAETLASETLTRVLYPDDSTSMGQGLRFLQEYFLVACSLGDLVRRFRRGNADWHHLPGKVAIQLNDTHPAMAVPELMRILLDEARLGWDEAWSITQRTLAYTNHTLLPEALETWPIQWFEQLLPRHLEIIREINGRLLDEVRRRSPGDEGRVARAGVIDQGPEPRVRMANLAIVGSHSTNGVSRIHSQLLRTSVAKDLAELFPERFNNKTNGVTPRRWLLMCNPGLSALISEAIGNEWITDLAQLGRLKPLAEESGFREAFLRTKRDAKLKFADWLRSTTGQSVDPDTIFDSHLKRIHEYKRQLLNALHIVVLYNRLRNNPGLEFAPRTFFFGGKAAPAYAMAKLIIKFINSLSNIIDADPVANRRLKVVFLPDYCVSLAERLIPASDVSEQISTAGYEASGTSNMKFMMNGALTIGTRDGATIEIAEEVGEENVFLFGLTTEQVLSSRGYYNPRWHYENEPETRAALDLVFSEHFNRHEPGIFNPIREMLLTGGDYYMHLADLGSYGEAHDRLGRLYADPMSWANRAILNVASSGRFSSDRTIAEYARDIWDVSRCPVVETVVP